MSTSPVTAVIVGAGHRGVGYSRLSHTKPEMLRITGVAEPDPIRRRRAAEMFDVPPRQCFETAQELARAPRTADAAINGTMDRDHVPTTLPLLEAGYDVLLEKPICPTRGELMDLLEAVRRTGRRLMIGHVLRYAPFYVAIKERVLAGEIGRIYAIHSSEAVSYHHMAAAFVRGKWRRRETNPMLLAKCCHDLDLMAWFKSGVRPVTVSSVGARTVFCEENAPEGSGTRCLVDCEIERDCPFSARRNYLEQGRWGTYAWEAIEHIEEPTDEDRERSLREDNPYGRCVYRCDNDVVDHQSVLVQFEDGTTATHDMVTGTPKPGRHIHLWGTEGEIEGFMEDGAFVVRQPDAREGHEYSEETVDLSVARDMHGGGDMRLVEDFVRVVRGEKPSISSTNIADSVYGHLIAFAADQAMLEGRVVEIEDIG
ncbi:MAG: Gfo/Idh/MocA family protein [Armatimonadota bacterium]